jgi:hypothetical protein
VLLAQELVNDNGISAIALSFFTALFAMVGTVLVAVIQNRNRTERLKNAVDQTAESAEAAKENTVNVSNGFTSRMDRKFDTVIENQDKLERAFQKHLEWHLNKETS